MANDTEPKYVNQLFKDLADNSTGPVTQRTILYGWDPVGLQKVKLKVASDGTLATSASLSGGGGDGSILDGVDNTIKATVKDVTGAKALAVAVVDASGNQITSFGGGTGGSGGVVQGTYNSTLPTITDTTSKDLQLDLHGYLRVRLGNNGVDANVSTPGDANANDTGIVAVAENLMYNGSTWDRVRGDTTNGLYVQVKSSVLPTGAATSAKQPALGTAGTASSDVLTVQGIASMTALKVDGSAVTQPVSGTFWQATQPVSGPLTDTQLRATAVPVSGTFWQTTQPISAASLPLPSGAATSAKQPALGTAGTASSDVLTVQGIASMTALKVDGSGVTQPVSGTFWQSTQPVSAASLPLPSGAATSAKQPALGTAGTASSDVLTVQGIASMTALKVDGSGVTQPVSGTFWQATQPVSGTVTVTQSTASSLKVDLSGTGANTTALKVDGSAVTQPVSGTFWQATQPVSIASAVAVTDNSGSLTVDAPVGTPVFATLTPSTTGGWSVSSLVALSSTKTQVKASAGTLGGYMFYNPNSSVVYIQVWNVASASITVGTTAPTYVIPIPATSGANIEFTNGINHSTAINVAATTTATGSTAPSTAVDGFIIYK